MPEGVTTPPDVSPDDLARARRLARLGIYNAVVGVILSLVFFPVGLVFDLLAISLGIRARKAAVQAQQSEGAGVVTVVLGGIGLSLVIAIGSMLALFWTEIRTYQSCSSGAITHSSVTACQTALSDDVKRRLGMG